MGSKKAATFGNDCTSVWADTYTLQSILEQLDVGGALGASHGSISRGGEGGGEGAGGGSSGASGSSAESTRRQGAGGTKRDRSQIRSAGQRPAAPLPSSYSPSPHRRTICPRSSHTSSRPSSPTRPARGGACCDFGAQVNAPPASSSDSPRRPPGTESESAISPYEPKRSARIAKLRAEAQRDGSASLTDLATTGVSARARGATAVRGSGRGAAPRSRAAGGGGALGTGGRAAPGPLRVTRTTFTRPVPSRAVKRCRARGPNVGDATELHLAVRMGDLGRMVQLLDEGAELEGRDAAGATPLHWAVRFVQTEAAQLLIDAGADVDAQVVPRGRRDSPQGQASLPPPPPHNESPPA